MRLVVMPPVATPCPRALPMRSRELCDTPENRPQVVPVIIGGFLLVTTSGCQLAEGRPRPVRETAHGDKGQEKSLLSFLATILRPIHGEISLSNIFPIVQFISNPLHRLVMDLWFDAKFRPDSHLGVDETGSSI